MENYTTYLRKHYQSKRRCLKNILIVFLLLFTGCYYIFNIKVGKVSQTEDNTFEVSYYFTKNAKSKIKISIPFSSCMVEDRENKPELIWYFEHEPLGRYGKIRTLTYGVVPEGSFKELQKPIPLLLNRYYYIGVSGAGCAGGVSFKITEENGEYKVISKHQR